MTEEDSTLEVGIDLDVDLQSLLDGVRTGADTSAEYDRGYFNKQRAVYTAPCGSYTALSDVPVVQARHKEQGSAKAFSELLTLPATSAFRGIRRTVSMPVKRLKFAAEDTISMPLIGLTCSGKELEQMLLEERADKAKRAEEVKSEVEIEIEVETELEGEIEIEGETECTENDTVEVEVEIECTENDTNAFEECTEGYIDDTEVADDTNAFEECAEGYVDDTEVSSAAVQVMSAASEEVGVQDEVSTPLEQDLSKKEQVKPLSEEEKAILSEGFAPKTLADNKSDSTDVVNVSETACTKDNQGVSYTMGMSLVEFLRANKQIRREEDVLKWYSKAQLQAALANDEVLIKKGKIIL